MTQSHQSTKPCADTSYSHGSPVSRRPSIENDLCDSPIIHISFYLSIYLSIYLSTYLSTVKLRSDEFEGTNHFHPLLLLLKFSISMILIHVHSLIFCEPQLYMRVCLSVGWSVGWLVELVYFFLTSSQFDVFHRNIQLY